MDRREKLRYDLSNLLEKLNRLGAAIRDIDFKSVEADWKRIVAGLKKYKRFVMKETKEGWPMFDFADPDDPELGIDESERKKAINDVLNKFAEAQGSSVMLIDMLDALDNCANDFQQGPPVDRAETPLDLRNALENALSLTHNVAALDDDQDLNDEPDVAASRGSMGLNQGGEDDVAKSEPDVTSQQSSDDEKMEKFPAAEDVKADFERSLTGAMPISAVVPDDTANLNQGDEEKSNDANDLEMRKIELADDVDEKQPGVVIEEYVYDPETQNFVKLEPTKEQEKPEENGNFFPTAEMIKSAFEKALAAPSYDDHVVSTPDEEAEANNEKATKPVVVVQEIVFDQEKQQWQTNAIEGAVAKQLKNSANNITDLTKCRISWKVFKNEVGKSFTNTCRKYRIKLKKCRKDLEFNIGTLMEMIKGLKELEELLLDNLGDINPEASQRAKERLMVAQQKMDLYREVQAALGRFRAALPRKERRRKNKDVSKGENFEETRPFPNPWVRRE